MSAFFRRKKETIEYKTCLRCGKRWLPRAAGRPSRCPACGISKWDQPRMGNEPGPKPKG